MNCINKVNRVSKIIHKKIAEIFLNKIEDFRIKNITITSVQLSKDFLYAEIFIFTLNKDPVFIKKILFLLKKASKCIKFLLKRSGYSYPIPSLKFIYDYSLDYGNNISNILHKYKK